MSQTLYVKNNVITDTEKFSLKIPIIITFVCVCECLKNTEMLRHTKQEKCSIPFEWEMPLPMNGKPVGYVKTILWRNYAICVLSFDL